MTTLYWHTTGTGENDLVLLHGWGLNSAVWHDIVPRLSPHFRLHLVDLPGYGRSSGFGALSLAEMAGLVQARAPDGALWLGWSLGGLVASQIALQAAEKVSGLITVASSPCFSARKGWPGIKSRTLAGFQQQLSADYQRTVKRFLALQTMGAESARQDARMLKQGLLLQPSPSVEALNGGLEILKRVDLRLTMASLTVPLLRIYGRLDGLVPRKVATLLDKQWPASQSLIMEKAAHTPFISAPAAFCQAISDFQQAQQ